ncbi:ATP-binding protein [Longibaculum muris]|uniref:ATP-binding protein n=1 Tax=Longibaculum muris TaxID=1796628 RepID=UPI0022E71E2A|nr:ATP-binding protein [Longibaculum muris]
MAAFLNTMDGTVLVGVEDDGSIYEPFQSVDKDYLDTKIANWFQDTIYPLPSCLVKHYFNEDGVLVIDIKEGKDKPYYLRKKGPKPAGVYKRVGRSIRKASEDEILRMIMSSKNYNYENDISDEQNLTFQSLTNAFKDNDIELNDRNLISLGIMNSNSKFTNLGFILSDQSDITVKIAEYDKQRNFKLKKQFTGSLIDLFYYVKEQADRLNDVSAKIDIKTFKRNEIVSYPGASLREIILNAFIHADYFIRSNIKIEFFEDKCKITSPGGIFNASMEEIMRGTQTYRNHKLVNIFDKLGLIENFGTGIPRTLDAYANEQRKPLFEATENFFYVTLPNLNYKVDDQINDQIHDQINELDLVILQTIFNHPGIKASEIKKN